MARSHRCEGCSARTTAYRWCQRCKSVRFHARKRITREALVVGVAGGGWWVWDARGDVLVIGRDTESEAFNALAFGDTTEREAV